MAKAFRCQRGGGATAEAAIAVYSLEFQIEMAKLLGPGLKLIKLEVPHLLVSKKS